jgi:hypothetical protein
MRAALHALGLILLSYASAASACGHCVEDKVAAVYDYAVVTQAFKQKHQVAFFGIDGALVVNDNSRREIEAIARDIPGLDKGSMRVSLESAALSVAFDPVRTSFAKLQSALERKLAPKKLSLLPMRVIDEPAKLKTVSK